MRPEVAVVPPVASSGTGGCTAAESSLTTLQSQAWASTHRGLVRPTNQDSFVSRCDAGLWMVADGVGGLDCGETASRIVASELAAISPSMIGSRMLAETSQAVKRAHERLGDMRQTGVAPASTVVILVLHDRTMTCA